MRAGWSKMDHEQKLQALREDVNTALDMAEDQEKRLKRVEDGLQRLSQQVYAIGQRLGIS